MWSFDQQFGDPLQWNTISNLANLNNGNSVYKPVAKYPVNYQEPININKYIDENAIQRPASIIINRPLIDSHHSSQFTRPQLSLHHMPREKYIHRLIPATTAAPTTVRSHFDSPIQEYLLHAQMPLPNARTFIMINRDATVEPEFLT